MWATRGTARAPIRGPLWRRSAVVPPASGSVVMATGIVSVALSVAGFAALSKVLMWLDVGVWLVLAAAFAGHALGDPRAWRAAADTPPALTAVAATTVLGTRLALFGWTNTACALLLLAAALWPVLLVRVTTRLRRRMPGAVFLVCVATQGLAVLTGQLALVDRGEWLAWTALSLYVLGLALYAVAFTRFDLRQVLTGAGDHWVAGGALAISAVAGSKLLASPVWTGTTHSALRLLTLVVLGCALGWYAVLAMGEVVRPRPRYDIRRWATVFPLGMTAAACLLVSTTAHVSWLGPLGRIQLWIATAAWTLTAAGLVRASTGWRAET
ncbi:tellurite resistance/C4-dicarboxylate transporter family protein [Streptomyces sp. SID3343]|uniref:tellurite resistance/C4-dicarboxylate transporter family protein n=1 Tax=Streptomyces sp. SID3343 TaxID=2690260 RepID=UPI0031F9862B